MLAKGGQKGFKGRPDDMMQSQRMEHQFYEQAEMLYQSVVDWNQPKSLLEAKWKQLMLLRETVSKALSGGSPNTPEYGKAFGKGKGGGSFASSPAHSTADHTTNESTNWKGELIDSYAKAYKQNPNSANMFFEVLEVQGNLSGKDRSTGYWARLTLDNQVFEGAVAPTKKEAEKMVSRSAMEIVFPEAFARLMQATPGQKRDISALEETFPKERLNHALFLLLNRSVMKSDIWFQTQETGDGQWISSVVLSLDPTLPYQGLPQSSKKLAEYAAAEAANWALSDQVAPLEEERKAKKLKKTTERMDAKRAMYADGGLGNVKSEWFGP